MKGIAWSIEVLVVVAFSSLVWGSEISLMVNNQPVYGTVRMTNELAVGTNEMAQLTSANALNGQYIFVAVIKDGITLSQPISDFSASASFRPLTVSGPATIKLSTGAAANFSSVIALATFKICPESFPPGQTLILPQGTIGVVHVESSTNLVQWQDEWTATFSNTNQNRFFRIRADRQLP